MPKKNKSKLGWMARSFVVFALACGSGAFASPLVDLRSRDYSIRIGTRENLRKPIPEDHKCLLAKDVVDALVRVQSALRLKNVSLRVLRCGGKAFERSEKCVGSPLHASGRAVDVSLVDKQGDELLSFADYDPCSCGSDKKATRGAVKKTESLTTLETAMAREGFDTGVGPWWHFEMRAIGAKHR